MTKEEISRYAADLELPVTETESSISFDIKVSSICPEEDRENIKTLLFLTNELLSKEVDATLSSAPIQFFGVLQKRLQNEANYSVAVNQETGTLTVDLENLPEGVTKDGAINLTREAISEAVHDSLTKLHDPESSVIQLHMNQFVVTVDRNGTVSVDVTPNVVMAALDYPSTEALSAEFTELWSGEDFMGFIGLIWSLQLFEKLHNKFNELTIKWQSGQVTLN